METLSWETAISGRAAMGKTNLKELCNCNARNLPSQLDIRCLQDSSQQPSEPHPKFSSIIKPFLRNFPLNRSTEEKFGAGTKLHSRAFKHELSQSSANGSDDNYRILSSLHGIAEAQQSNGKSDAEEKTGADISETKIGSPGNNSGSMESFLNGEESYLPLNDSELENPEAQEVCGDASHISSNAKSDQSSQENRSNWVLKVMDLRSYFKDDNPQYSSNSGSNSIPPDGSTSSTTRNSCTSEVSVNNGDCGHYSHSCNCNNCNDDDLLCSVMEEHFATEETVDRESFSRVLHRVSLPQTKLFSQLSFLCVLAYSVPEIKNQNRGKNWKVRF